MVLCQLWAHLPLQRLTDIHRDIWCTQQQKTGYFSEITGLSWFCCLSLVCGFLLGRVLLHSPDWPQTHDPTAWASQVLGLEARATM
jgi:hypothetical protein